MKTHLGHWTTRLGHVTGHPAAFIVVVTYGLAWFVFDRETFNLSSIATLMVWIMTLLIQRADHRDTEAIHAKLDELLRANADARTELADIDDEEPEDIEKHRIAEGRKRDREPRESS